MPEEVADHLHRRALIKQMLGCGMPQGVSPASPGDDADASQSVTDHLAQGRPARAVGLARVSSGRDCARSRTGRASLNC